MKRLNITTMKKNMLLLTACLFLIVSSCGDASEQKENPAEVEKTVPVENPGYDPLRGEGKFKDVVVDEKLNVQMAQEGEIISDIKCASCHRMTKEKLVGPGWQGVTTRRHPDWIMNFITNPDVMIDKDPEAQAMLELCLVRMPNQSLTDDEARNILEFMRKNDGVKP